MAGFNAPLKERDDVEELEDLLLGGSITQAQLDSMEEAFAQEEEQPREKAMFTRCINWCKPGEFFTHKKHPLSSIPHLREMVIMLPEDAFIIVTPRSNEYSWFTQCCLVDGEYTVDCSRRIMGENYVRRLHKAGGDPWRAHEVFLVMATFIQSRRVDPAYTSELTIY